VINKDNLVFMILWFITFATVEYQIWDIERKMKEKELSERRRVAVLDKLERGLYRLYDKAYEEKETTVINEARASAMENDEKV